MTAILAATAAGCFGFSALRIRNQHDYPSHRLVDMLPYDLNTLNNSHIIGGLGVQLLLMGGFEKTSNGEWARGDDTTRLSTEDRLLRITPTWKGGHVDYSYDNPNAAQISVFGDALDAGISVAELADKLQDMGLHAEDFDTDSRAAISTMLSWNLPFTDTILETDDVTLLVFSFDATPLCRTVDDCPYPGPTNELLAATAAQFFAKQNVRKIVAQWEVASALLQWHTDSVPPDAVVAIGEPGTYENTVQILEKMTCNIHQDTTAVVVLAHPDHLRRVYHTTQTLWKKTMLRNNKCTPPSHYKLLAAMHPYTLDWPSKRHEASDTNLFLDITSALVHTQQTEKLVTWYDDNLGYFPDGNPQKWVHRQDVWILYDHWAMLKGIVSGII